MRQRIGLTILLTFALGGVGWWLRAMVNAGAEPKDWIGPPIALVAVGISAMAWRQSRRSANAATKNAELAQRNEERGRYGWSITLHPNGDRYVLRNVGTVAARDVRFGNPEDFAVLAFIRPSGNMGPSILSGEAKAFTAAEAFGRVGTEVVVEWIAPGESERRTFNEVLPPAPNPFAGHVKERDQKRASDQAAHTQDVAETRRLLLELANAWGNYIVDTANAATKLWVQALVAALPSNYAKEFGYAVDVPRDYWGPNQWPMENLVADENDKQLVAKDAPIIELIWNLLDVQMNLVAHGGYSAPAQPDHRIEDAVHGYIDLVRRHERGDRELIESPADRKDRKDAEAAIEQFKLQNDSPNPQTSPP